MRALVGYEMIIYGQREAQRRVGYKVIISYSTGASGIIVLLECTELK